MKRSLIISCAFVLLATICYGGVTWSDPVLLTELNDSVTGQNAIYPHLSSDGSALYFGRRDVSGDRKLYTATRDGASGVFSNITEIDELYNGGNLHSPSVSADGLRLYYSRYAGSYTRIEMCVATRIGLGDEWNHLMTFSDIHTAGTVDMDPSLTPDELTMFYISDRGNANNDTRIWMATRSSINDQFSSPVKVTELDNGRNKLSPCLLPDGLTIYYAEKSNDQYDIFRATRDSFYDSFSNIESISLNTPLGIEGSPYVTADESEIFFATENGIMYAYQVPEPATLCLLTLGAVFLRKRK